MRRLALAAAAALLWTGAAAAQTAPAASPVAAPDYAQSAAWLCRPGRADVCDAPLEALARGPDGARVVRRFPEAASPPIDCFYVYPTVSADPTTLSDLTPGPEEVRVVVGQAARFASRCRLFAPVYRQVTLAGLSAALHSGAAGDRDFNASLADVRAAWRDYLRRDNGGRGVVLLGHSQGAILLARLLTEEIAPDPAQRRLLVSAVLAGHPGLPVTNDAFGQGAAAVPLCRRAEQTGCIVVFASYAADDAGRRGFGVSSGSGTAGCVNPAALAGGSGPLTAYLRRPPGAPETDPPYVEAAGVLTAECVTDAAGSVLRVRTPAGPAGEAVARAVAAYPTPPGWGLHPLDMTLTQGTLLDLVERQGRAYAAARR